MKLLGKIIVGFVALIVLIGVFGGWKRVPDNSSACSTHRGAYDSALAFHRKLADSIGQESDDPTAQIFLDAPDHIEVTLIFPGMKTAHYSVTPDCEVKFA